MESRMEKYYREDISNFERSKKNQKLYKEVSREISDLDNLPIPDNSNEIDLDGLKQIISSRDEYRKSKELEKTFTSTKPLVEETKTERVYDINVLLENAKNEVNRSNTITNKKTINTNFLTTLEEANIPEADEAIEVSMPLPDKKENKNINTTDSLPLDILMDLKGNENTVVTDPIVKEEVTMIKEIKDGETFYSGSFSFSKKDFDEEEEFFEEKKGTGIKIFFLILGILILIGAVYLILTKYVL